MTVRRGKWRGDKTKFVDGTYCDVRYALYKDGEELDVSDNFIDFPAADIDDLIGLLQELKESKEEEVKE